MKRLRWIMVAMIVSLVMKGTMAQGTSSSDEKTTMLTSSDIIDMEQDSDQILLSDLLSTFEEHFNVTFLYKDEVMDNKYAKRDNIQIGEETSHELSRILDQLGLAFQQINEQTYVLLSKHELLRSAQVQEEISGRVTDAQTGETLPGVNVMVKGTTTGTSTDGDGSFEITVESLQDTLVFSFIGYQTREVPINGRTEIDVALQPQAIAGEELVVVGYGTQRREEVTSSISHVSEEDFAQGTAYQSPLQLLSGKVAGLAISRASGGDPTSGIQMQLRGVSSVRGDNSPLVVIDGVPGGSLDVIPPESIESIDILRDGSASAIYGTRANAGVIIISTKSGKQGSPEISYSGYVYTERYANKPDVLTADQYRQLKNEWANSDDPFWRSLATPMLDYGHNTDWFDVISQDAMSQVHNVSISGGSESTRYQGSLNYRNQNGLIKETGQDEVSGRMSFIHTALDDRLTVNLRLNNTFSKSHPFDGQIMAEPYYRNPTQPVYNTDSSLEQYLYNPDGKYFEISGYYNANPLGLIEQYDRKNRSSIFLGSGKVSYELIGGLEASIMAAYERTDNNYDYYESRDSWESWNNTQANGVATKSSSLMETRTMESTLNYETEFVGKHSVDILVGYSYQEMINESFNASNRTFLSDAFGTNNLGAGLQISRGAFSNPVGSSKNSNKLISGFGRLSYSYNNKYMLSASIRREGSTKFGANNKWGNFPAISAGWRIGSENFMDNINFINDLKVRIGYGITGNQGIPNYLSLSRLGRAGFMLYQGEWIPGYAPSSNINPNLRWEKKAETNIGIETTIFDNISFTVDIYDRTTTDLLYEYRVPVPPNIYERTWANVGSINNRGVEFSISTNLVSSSTFSWKSDFNISYNENELESLSNETYERSFLMLGMPNAGRLGLSGETIYRVEEGEPIGNIYTWKHAGFTEDGRWLVWDESNTNKIHPSEATFEDRRITGNGLPKSWLGFNNTFTYKSLDLRFSLRGALGFDLLNAIHLHRAKPNTIPDNMPLRGIKDSELSQVRDQRNYVDSYWIERGDYIKLDNITLGYTFPVGVVNVKQLRVYVSGQNLYTLTKYKGEDPEQSIQGLIPGYDDYWEYPSTKTFSVGLDITF